MDTYVDIKIGICTDMDKDKAIAAAADKLLADDARAKVPSYMI